MRGEKIACEKEKGNEKRKARDAMEGRKFCASFLQAGWPASCGVLPPSSCDKVALVACEHPQLKCNVSQLFLSNNNRYMPDSSVRPFLSPVHSLLNGCPAGCACTSQFLVNRQSVTEPKLFKTRQPVIMCGQKNLQLLSPYSAAKGTLAYGITAYACPPSDFEKGGADF
jgi:hypothetical protein